MLPVSDLHPVPPTKFDVWTDGLSIRYEILPKKKAQENECCKRRRTAGEVKAVPYKLFNSKTLQIPVGFVSRVF
jgi:hypothetical protein